MIRFIDLTGQIDFDSGDPHFAFFDTVRDRFCTIDEEQEWSSLSEFLDALNNDKRHKRQGQRYLNNIPVDYFNERA